MRTFSYPGGIYNATPPRVVFGPGSVAGVGAEVVRLGARRALVVTTPGRRALGERIAALIGERCVGVLAEAVSQVPIELARRGREQAQALEADCLVSVGGGASVGLGKGIALGHPLPIIALPTTYSGSEMTGFCGITIDGVKRMHTSLDMLARTVIYDAELSLSLPNAVSAASAMNALAHCIDAIYVPSLSPLLAAAAVDGAAAIVGSLGRVLAVPDDLQARNELLYGAYLGGAALTGGFALQHGLAHVLGGSFGVEHGLAHALILPQVAAYNAHFAPHALGRIAAALGTDNLGGTLFDLLTASGLPTRLADLGLDEADLQRAVAVTLETEKEGSPNPGPVTAAAVGEILRRAHQGVRPG